MIFIFFLAAATIGGLLGVDLSPRRRDDDDDGLDGDVNDMYAQAGLTSENIVKLVMKALDINNNEFKIIKS